MVDDKIADKLAAKSGLVYTIASLVNAGIVFITIPFFTRVMSQTSFGEYNNFLSWYNILSILSLNLSATFISANNDFKNDVNSYVFSMSILSMVVLIISGIIFNTFGSFFKSVFGLSQLFINFLLIYIVFYQFFSLYQINERYKFCYKLSAILIIICSIATAGLSIVLVLVLKDQFLGRVIGLLVPTIVIGAICIVILVNRKGKLVTRYWKYALPISLPYIPHLLSLTVLNSIDKVMISSLIGNNETAIYSVAYTCGSLVSFVVGVFNNAFAPWFINNFTTREKEVRNFSRYYVLAFQFILIGILLLAPELIFLLGGEKYSEALKILPSIVIGCSMQLQYTMYVNVEQFYKRTGYMAFATVAAAALNYFLNSIYIPRYGYEVASITTLVSYFVLSLLHIIILHLIKKGKIFDIKMNLSVLVLDLFLVVIFTVLLKNTYLRICVIIIYVGFSVLFILRKKKQIFEYLNYFRGER